MVSCQQNHLGFTYHLITFPALTKRSVNRAGGDLSGYRRWLDRAGIHGVLLGLLFEDRYCVYPAPVLWECQEISEIITNGSEMSPAASLSTPGLLNSTRWALTCVFPILLPALINTFCGW